MVLRAENNPFPSVLFEEHVDPANPDAGTQRLFVDTDHVLKLIDSSGTVTTFSGGVTDHGALTGLSDDDHTQYVLRSILTTNGDLFTRTGGAVARLGVGSDGDVLTVASGAPSWAAPTGGGGALTLLEQHTASSSAALNFTTFISSTYDEYVFEFLNVLPATDGTNFVMQVGTGGGPTYDTGNNYGWAGWRWAPGGSAIAGSGGTSSIGIDCSGGVDATGTSSGVCGSLRLFDPQNSSIYKRVTGGPFSYFDNANTVIGATLSGFYLSATAVTAVRFLMASGNIASGTIRAYGVEK